MAIEIFANIIAGNVPHKPDEKTGYLYSEKIIRINENAFSKIAEAVASDNLKEYMAKITGGEEVVLQIEKPKNLLTFMSFENKFKDAGVYDLWEKTINAEVFYLLVYIEKSALNPVQKELVKQVDLKQFIPVYEHAVKRFTKIQRSNMNSLNNIKIVNKLFNFGINPLDLIGDRLSDSDVFISKLDPSKLESFRKVINNGLVKYNTIIENLEDNLYPALNTWGHSTNIKSVTVPVVEAFLSSIIDHPEDAGLNISYNDFDISKLEKIVSNLNLNQLFNEYLKFGNIEKRKMWYVIPFTLDKTKF